MTGDDLQGLHIVVTGGSGALGAGVLAVLLERGATCHVPCVEAQVPGDFALARHERVHAAPAIDLTSEASTRAYFDSVPTPWASIHLAGGFAMAAIADTSLADFQRMMLLNAATCFLSCREAIRAIRRAGDRGGRLVNVAARPVLQPAPGMSAYLASKAAVAALTQGLAVELLEERILVNAVLPSVIDTEANRRAMPDADHDLWPVPAEIAEAVAFLVSPRNTLTSGALVPVYGRA